LKKGLFISFEGNDGSGKTTQIRKLKSYLEDMGYEVILLREPGATPIGEKIRDLLLDNLHKEMCPVTEMMLYAASRAQMVDSIVVPSLEKGICVICDRFVDSSYAYQAFGRELGLDVVRSVNAPAIQGCLPDLTFFMDIDADTAMQRRNSTGEALDRLESEEMEFHRRAHEGYLTLSRENPKRIRRIPANHTPEEIFDSIREHMMILLQQNHG
jgi:dTMP kinase